MGNVDCAFFSQLAIWTGRSGCHGSWRRAFLQVIQAIAYMAAWRDGDAAFQLDRRWDRLVSFLFPEIAEQLITTP
uniref:Uncharacterized protein ORF SG88 n=1 Tax=Pseudomonas aeruginosa TaxID=287 RepID=Q8GPR5_PSEAI|nr:hypothetical protein [Pseudomonas aeruginosa]